MGDVVRVTGPTGKGMLLPEDAAADIIMVATGTGIAPYRSFIRRLFVERTPAARRTASVTYLTRYVRTSALRRETAPTRAREVRSVCVGRAVPGARVALPGRADDDLAALRG